MKRRIKKAKKDDDKKIFDLKDLNLQEVSLVDEGANPGAAIMLFKRHDKKEFLNKLKSKFKKDAQSFEDVEGKQDAFDAMWNMFSSFQDSIHSILGDDDVKDKQTLVTESLGQFNEALSDALTKGGHSMATKTKAKKAGDKDELDATAKTEHENEIAALKAEHEEEMAAMKTEHEDELKAKKVEDEEETTKAEDEEDEKEKDETAKAINKKFASLEKRNSELEKRLAKSDERIEKAKFEKMADAFEFVPVEKDKLGALLQHVSKADDDGLYDTLEKVLGASSESQNLLTKMTGNPLSNSSGTAATAFYAKAKEYQDSEGVSKQKGVAITKTKHPELWTAMRKETN